MARRKRKQQQQEAGAPAWMVTYGDMMTLLLCFFVILVSLSELKREDQFKAVVREIQKAFGMRGGGGKMVTPEDPTRSMIPSLDAQQYRDRSERHRAQSPDVGVEGKSPAVTTVREEPYTTVGGVIYFPHGSSTLTDRARAKLAEVAKRPEMAGVHNRIEVVGHADSMECLSDNTSEPLSPWQLSYKRSAAVMQELQKHNGLSADRFRLVAAGSTRMSEPRSLDQDKRASNRRAQIVLRPFEVDPGVRD